MPVNEELQLDMLDAIVGEDAFDRWEAELLDGIDDIGMNEPEPAPAHTRGNFDAFTQREGTYLARGAGIRIPGNRPV
jgi:hypothetical protein